MTTSRTILVLDPTAKANVVEEPLAPRVSALEGLRLGILDNTKPNIDLFEDRLEELLRQRFGFREVLRRRKRTSTDAAASELLDELAATCDIVINGVGD